MKRRGFITWILAALGVGIISRANRGKKPGQAPPAPPCRACFGKGEILTLTSGWLPCHLCSGSLEGRLTAMIARDRAQGLEVNYFHTNRATMEDLRAEIGVFHDDGPLSVHTKLTYAGVTWWGVEHMAHHEILVSDVGIIEDPAPCPRCGGAGEIPAGQTLAVSKLLPGMSPCPRCQPIRVYKSETFGRSPLDNEDLIRLQREKNRRLARKLDRYRP